MNIHNPELFAVTDRQNKVIDMNEAVLEMSPFDEYNQDLRMPVNEFFTILNDLQAERYLEAAWTCQKTGSLVRDSQFRAHPTTGKINRIDGYFAKNMDSNAIHKAIVHDLSSLYFGYADMVNEKGKLVMPDGFSLSAIEMKILHYTICGQPAKDVGKIVHRSTASVESCLRRLKEKLYTTTDPDLSLIQILNKKQLIQFLAASPNWGKMEDTYYTF